MVDGERLEIPATVWSCNLDDSDHITYYMDNSNEIWTSVYNQLMDLEEGHLLDAIIKALEVKGYTVTKR